MHEHGESATPTILIVDDHEANRLLVQSTLEDEGYRVTLACDGPQALRAFSRDNPDCVLLDVRMPGLDGFAVCERIRAMEGGAETPIIFLTALRDVDTFDAALRAGGDDFLAKPVRPNELVVRVEAALQLRRLRRELRAHYDMLRKQRDDLMRLNLQKERLVAFVVHDLKNPVHAMDLHAQLLLRQRGLSPDARASAARIRAEAQQLTRMITNLLDVSKADEGKLVPKRSRVALASLVSDIFAELEVDAQDRQVGLRGAIEAHEVRADEDLLRRLLANLIENALRHSAKGSHVTVTAGATREGMEIRVIDAGSGVPVEMRERIFDPFVQGTDGSERFASRTGRGLGLAFCKLAAEAHGGAIWIEDACPGSVFCVRLPHEP